MILTRRHFQAFALEIRFSGDYTDDQRIAAAQIIARVLRQFNNRFDDVRFYTACGLDEHGRTFTTKGGRS